MPTTHAIRFVHSMVILLVKRSCCSHPRAGWRAHQRVARLFDVDDLLARGGSLLYGCELGHAGGDTKNLVFTDDQIFLAVQLDLRARVLPAEDELARLDVRRNRLP